MKDKMNRRQFIKSASIGLTALSVAGIAGCLNDRCKLCKPNIVIIYTDDQGYGDVGRYGAQGFETPNLDQLADEGLLFTSFYSACSVCSPSRAALLTGCYPKRVGINQVLYPDGPAWTFNMKNVGLNPEETTIADMLKKKGYSSACIGKWHLGHHKEFLPTRQGFDYYFGLPYSNDMIPAVNEEYPPIPLIENEEAIELNPDQSQLTTRYTEKALSFIEKNKNKPFFLYLAHTMPHVPLGVSDKFAGKSEQGMYGDVIMEIDWSVGQIMDKLKKLNIDENTLVVFSSDNGPWLAYGNHGGSAGPLREGKMTTFEGGHRVPCIMRWPLGIEANRTTDEVATTMDLLPTIAAITRCNLPDQIIDGKDVSPILFNELGARTPHEMIYFYKSGFIQAVRYGKWKLHFEHGYQTVVEPGVDGKHGVSEDRVLEPSLYDLDIDPGETKNLASEHPDLVKEMVKRAQIFDYELEQKMRKSGRVKS